MTEQLRDRVLLVNGELHIRILISECLVSAGYVVWGAVDGLDAIGTVRSGPPATRAEQGGG
jgi:CheY-like chemotaxis protein